MVLLLIIFYMGQYGKGFIRKSQVATCPEQGLADCILRTNLHPSLYL